MFMYDVTAMTTSLRSVIERNISAEALGWLTAEVTTYTRERDVRRFNMMFASLPRRTGKAVINVDEVEARELQTARPGLTIYGWTVDRLCRAWLLLQLDPSDKAAYIHTIENLFAVAEMNEQVALYAALPLLAYPEAWRMRCAEGIRSNIGSVLDALMCNNPYPSEQLEEPAWNQLVLKAVFTGKPLLTIYGLKERANQDLAGTLADYARERWAARRPVNPLLWYCVGSFINARIFSAIERVANSEHTVEREAALLACSESNYAPARELLQQQAEMKALVERGEITWNAIAEKAELVV